ncbi:UNVERIFIED_CONTAM: Dixdc1 [Trichonephila clavipes]
MDGEWIYKKSFQAIGVAVKKVGVGSREKTAVDDRYIVQQARLRAYVGWLNSQLRKEEGGVRRVSDLRNDLRDGVILSHLVASLGK